MRTLLVDDFLVQFLCCVNLCAYAHNKFFFVIKLNKNNCALFLLCLHTFMSVSLLSSLALILIPLVRARLKRLKYS